MATIAPSTRTSEHIPARPSVPLPAGNRDYGKSNREIGRTLHPTKLFLGLLFSIACSANPGSLAFTYQT